MYNIMLYIAHLEGDNEWQKELTQMEPDAPRDA